MKKELPKLNAEELADKIKQGHATPAEQEEFDKWYAQQANKAWHVAADFANDQVELKNRIFHRIENKLGFVNPSKKRGFNWQLVIAACVLFVLGIGLFFVFTKQVPDKLKIVQHEIPNLAPGKNKAILQLSDGKKITLDDAQQGQLAADGHSIIQKTANGQIVYKNNEFRTSALPAINNMSTPRGGQYQLILSDGTKVWLNASSSITYPAAFIGKLREVSVTGEVYFEVAHNATKPFRVKCGKQTIEVLGTHFNINAYDSEQAISTTLIEGSVTIAAGQQKRTLLPGQQANVKGEKIDTQSADVDEVIAWKNGYFQFSNTDIQTVMRQISRWYDVDVEFVGPISNEVFTGRISRNRNINQVLKIVQSSKSVHLSFEGRRIMVRQ